MSKRGKNVVRREVVLAVVVDEKTGYQISVPILDELRRADTDDLLNQLRRRFALIHDETGEWLLRSTHPAVISEISWELGRRGVEIGIDEALTQQRKKSAPKSGSTAPINDATGERIIELHKQGLPNTKIEREVSKGRNAIGRYINERCDCDKCKRKRSELH